MMVRGDVRNISSRLLSFSSNKTCFTGGIGRHDLVGTVSKPRGASRSIIYSTVPRETSYGGVKRLEIIGSRRRNNREMNSGNCGDFVGFTVEGVQGDFKPVGMTKAREIIEQASTDYGSPGSVQGIQEFYGSGQMVTLGLSDVGLHDKNQDGETQGSNSSGNVNENNNFSRQQTLTPRKSFSPAITSLISSISSSLFGYPIVTGATNNTRSCHTQAGKGISQTEHNYLDNIEQDFKDRTSSIQGVQGPLSGNAGTMPAISLDMPCPQGVQGEDCTRFKLWLENCHKYAMVSCDQQFEDYTAGRKTLNQIFAEQEQAIARVTKRRAENMSQSGGDEAQAKPQDLSQVQRLKLAIRDYGSTVVVFHVGISLLSFGGFYLAVSSGIDMVGLLSRIEMFEAFFQSKLAAGASTVIVAYAVHKVFAPVRIAITLSSTPFIVTYLRKTGFLRPKK